MMSKNLVVHCINYNEISVKHNLRYISCMLWLTGLSRAGKSTIGTLFIRELWALGQPCDLLDGDVLR